MRDIDAVGITGVCLYSLALFGIYVTTDPVRLLFWILLGVAFGFVIISVIFEGIRDWKESRADKIRPCPSIKIGSVVHFTDGSSKTISAIENPEAVVTE